MSRSSWTATGGTHVATNSPLTRGIARDSSRYAGYGWWSIHLAYNHVAFTDGVKMLEACMRLEIRCVSAYAFAMDNFKRSPEEIEHLMDLAHDKLMEMSRHGCVRPTFCTVTFSFSFLFIVQANSGGIWRAAQCAGEDSSPPSTCPRGYPPCRIYNAEQQ